MFYTKLVLGLALSLELVALSLNSCNTPQSAVKNVEKTVSAKDKATSSKLRAKPSSSLV